MPEPKTKPTQGAARDHVAAIGDDARRADCEALVRWSVAELRRRDPLV